MLKKLTVAIVNLAIKTLPNNLHLQEEMKGHIKVLELYNTFEFATDNILSKYQSHFMRKC